MATEKKYALAPCSGMSPYGLITRAASTDTVQERDDLVSLCMGATSADREGFRELIRKYPIIAINGCEGSCVDKILEQKGVKVAKVINAKEELNSENLKPTDVVRLDDEGEKCVLAMKKKINELID
ncbi:putative zinc-binding protein [Methanobacterium sp. ACI-7]|uniref:putative zinc-binding protein n=1 Tax=unclassified Methanobacterium TaxID=2627676 RepID=UPI0039C09C05